MAVNAYLILDGVEGPSTSRAKAIDILSFSFGASNSTVIGPGSSGSETKAGRANIQDLNLMKVLDKTSPTLFNYCVTGTTVKTATIYYDKPMGDKQADYFKIELTNAIITSVQLSGSSENPVESVSLAFEKVKVGYNPENPDGKSLKGFVEKGFDLMTLKPF